MGFPYAPTSLDEFEIYPEVPARAGNEKAAGFLLIVATNQPDVGRGTHEAGIGRGDSRGNVPRTAD